NPVGIKLNFDSETFEHIRRADTTADGTIAMFGDRHAGRSGDQRRAGRDVECARAVPSGSSSIKHIAGVEIECAGARAHGSGSAGKLGGRLALELERDEKACDKRIRRFAVEYLAHYPLGTGGVERATGEHGVESVAQLLHAATVRRKLASNRFPSRVPMDSGWNWMPSIGSVRCRSPITSPSAVRALTCRQTGIE